jgi:hypothetical protein
MVSEIVVGEVRASATGTRRGREMTEFEGKVLADLCVLKSQMASLLGEGQPGRLSQIERQVDRHERGFQRARGIGFALGGLFTLMQLGLEYLRRR